MRGPWRVLAAARIVHPFPTLLNVAATAGLAVVASGGNPGGGVLARMSLAMLCAQCAIGVTNDLYDRELDAATKPWKPLVTGSVSMRAAVALALVFAVSAAILAATLGAASFALALLGMACGLAYDARLKRTVLSALPYMIAIPTLPLWVWATLGAWENVLWWLAPLGALIGLSLHLANTLPDIEADQSRGVRGLAHRLGAERSRTAAWESFAAALALAAVIAPLVDGEARVLAPALAFAAACLAASIGVWSARRDGVALQFGFGALGIGSAVAAVGWLAAVT
jgi:4-hydroxybenzoate polyprenyltransferase